MFFNFDSKWDSTGTRYKEKSSNGQKLTTNKKNLPSRLPNQIFIPLY